MNGMKIITIEKWVDRKTNSHRHGFVQVLEKGYYNVIIFGVLFKEVFSFKNYINEFPD